MCLQQTKSLVEFFPSSMRWKQSKQVIKKSIIWHKIIVFLKSKFFARLLPFAVYSTATTAESANGLNCFVHSIPSAWARLPPVAGTEVTKRSNECWRCYISAFTHQTATNGLGRAKSRSRVLLPHQPLHRRPWMLGVSSSNLMAPTRVMALYCYYSRADFQHPFVAWSSGEKSDSRYP